MNLIISKSKNSKSLYIQKSYRKNGKTTSKIVKKLGTMKDLLPLHNNSEDEVIAWAKSIAKKMTDDEKRNTDNVLISLSQSKLINHNEQALFNGGYLFIQDLFYKLKLDKMCDEISKKYQFQFDLTHILSRLIYSRIIYPSSKLSTFNDSKKLIEQPNFELHDIYRALDILSNEDEFIQEYIYESSLNVIKRDTGILYYDCTNYFFEIEEEKGNRKYGKSKEHRPNPIIQMGLLMDGNGYPLSFVIFPGNESEQPTLIPLEKRIIKDFELSRFVICTDAGLSSAENRQFNNKGNRSYIVTQSLKKIKSHIKEWALDSNGWHKDGSAIEEDISSIIEAIDNHSSDISYDDIWYKERWINENGIEQRLIVSFSPKHRSYARQIRKRQVERAKITASKNKTVINRNPNSPARFLDEIHYTENGEVASDKKVCIDESKILEEERYDGFYAVCTTLEDPVKDIIKINKRRWEIEESFRIIKSEFEARPVYLQKDNRIKAHFLTCFIALLMIRIMEKKTKEKFSIEKLIDTLKNMNFQRYEGSGYVPVYTRDEVTDELHNAFNFRTDYQIISEKNMNKIIKQTKKY
jgi:transposase